MIGSRIDKGQMRERIKAARIAAELSQEELAKSIGVSREAISQIERGDSKQMKADNLLRIAAAVGVSANWLVFGIEEGGDLASRPAAGGAARRPLLSWREIKEYTTAGHRRVMTKENTARTTYPTPIECSTEAFWLTAETDACGDVIEVGALILVDPAQPVRSGDYVICMVGGKDPTIRRIIIDGGTRYALSTGPAWSRERVKLGAGDSVLGRVAMVCRTI